MCTLGCDVLKMYRSSIHAPSCVACFGRSWPSADQCENSTDVCKHSPVIY